MSEGRYNRLPPIEAFRHCGSCPPRAQTMPVESPLAIGFGSVSVTRDDDVVWQGDEMGVLLMRFELMAREAPDHDWRVHIDGPLYSATYQRHGRSAWVLVVRGEGFA